MLSDSSSLTPGKITADKQVAAILHRGRAFEARDLAALAAGSDPMAAIGAKVADYVANQRQKDLLSCLQGVFGSLNANTSSSAFFDLCIDSESGDTPTALSPRHVAEARAILGDQGEIAHLPDAKQHGAYSQQHGDQEDEAEQREERRGDRDAGGARQHHPTRDRGGRRRHRPPGAGPQEPRRVLQACSVMSAGRSRPTL